MQLTDFITPDLAINGGVTLTAIVVGLKVSLNGMKSSLKDLKTGQGEVKETLGEHGERLTRVETHVELMHPKE